jgi:anti-sigma regulatory factor (Ser/Thr protein kinase)
VVFDADGPRLVEVTPAAPLGALPYGNYPEHEVSVEPGATVVLYTDGLVERPGEPLGDGIARLIEVLRGAASAEEACDRLARNLVAPGGPRDDVAIVALENTAIPRELRLSLPADPRVLSQVRRVVRRWLRDRGAGDEEVTQITLAISEACANAIEHAYSPAPAAFAVAADTAGDEVTFTVSDTGNWRAPRGQNRGRGLTIMEAAMDDVQVGPTTGGTKIVMRRRLARAR